MSLSRTMRGGYWYSRVAVKSGKKQSYSRQVNEGEKTLYKVDTRILVAHQLDQALKAAAQRGLVGVRSRMPRAFGCLGHEGRGGSGTRRRPPWLGRSTGRRCWR